MATAAVLLGSAFWIFDLPDAIGRFAPFGWTAPTVATIALIAGLIVLCAAWRAAVDDPSERRPRWSYAAAAVVIVAAVWALERTISAWMNQLVLIAIDPYRADMLVEIQAAAERLWIGKDPYAVYHVPWALPLSYGPWLWMWYLIPYGLGADLRLMTVVGQVFVPSLLAVAAAVEARSGRYLRPAILAALAWVVLGNPPFGRFVIIGHTPAYWPLIALFALTCAGRHYRSAAIALGALLGARTTMVALVPVFFMDAWRNDRKAVLPAALFVTLTAAMSFAPFLLWDWRTLTYGMYGYYVESIRDAVWKRPDWMAPTLGLTRFLVASGHEGYVVISQVVAMVGVYALTWWRLRPGQSAGPWMCVALAVFSMTTLWPVWYVFLDVFVLGLAFLAADQVAAVRRIPWRTMGATTLLALSATLLTLAINPGVYYTIEPGRTARWHLRSGFGPDERDGDRGFAWAQREVVHLRLPRGFRTDAAITIECDPFPGPGERAQTIAASLNGVAIGRFVLHPGWQTVTFRTASRAWRVGHNDMTLFFRYVLPSASGEPRAVRVSRIAITR